MSTLDLNHLIIGDRENPLVICATILICLCNPMLPPSGVSKKSINPHCEPCNNRGPITFALASNGKLIFLRCANAELNDKRFKS